MRRGLALYCSLLAALIAACLIIPVRSAGATSSSSDYVADEVLVRLKPGVNARAFAAANGLKTTSRSVDQLNGHDIYRLQIADGSTPAAKAGALASKVQVEYAEPNYIGMLPEARRRSSWTVGGAESDYLAQWAPGKIRLPEAHQVTRGANVMVAILDTGVDMSHPALAGHLVPGYDFVDLDSDPSEQGIYGQDGAYGHGTHVAGLVTLVAPDAKILPLRTLGPDGVGTLWAQAQALLYAVDHGANVINLSYSFDEPSQLIDDILSEVTCTSGGGSYCGVRTRPGVVVVAASGNSGESTREYPAGDSVPGVLAVAASTEADTLASFSTYGSWVKLAAPGEHIISTVPGGLYATWSGTSMAAPLAAGTAALVRARYPSLKPSAVITWIASTAAPIDSQVRRRLDAASAVITPR